MLSDVAEPCSVRPLLHNFTRYGTAHFIKSKGPSQTWRNPAEIQCLYDPKNL